MSGYEWLTVWTLVVSIIASGTTIWAHLRINKIYSKKWFTTSGGQSLIITSDSAINIDRIFIDTGGKAPYLNNAPPS